MKPPDGRFDRSHSGRQSGNHSASRLTEVLPQVIETMGIAVCQLDLDYRVVACNEKARQIYGEGIVGRTCYAAVDGSDTVCPGCPAEKVHQGHPSARSQRQRIDVSGNRIHIDQIATPIYDHQGRLSGVIVLIVDITHHKQMEDALQQQRLRLEEQVSERTAALAANEQKLRAMFDQSNDAIFMHTLIEGDRPGKFTDVNETACRRLGYSREEFRRMTPAQIDAAELHPRVSSIMQQLLSQGQVTFEMNHVGRDGILWPVEITSRLIDFNGEKRVLSSARDISLRKKTERILQERERYYRTILQSVHEDILVISSDYVIEDINDAYLKLTGQRREEVVGRKCFEVSHGYGRPCDQHGEDCRLQEVFETGRPCSCIHQHQRADGRSFWADVALSPMRDDDGRVVKVIEAVRDISDVIRSQEEQKRLIAAVEQTNEIVVITDTDATIQYVNPAFESVTGYTRREAVGRNPRILQSGVHDHAFYGRLWDTLRRGDTWRERFVNRKKDGSHYIEDAVISPVFDGAGRTVNYVAVKRDITQELEREERLQQAHKLESIGVLAGGIAHDFNNILFPIVGLSEMLMEDLDADSAEHQKAREIFLAGQRGSQLVKQILAFSRRSERQTVPVRLQTVLREALKLSRSTIPADIGIVQDIQQDCGPVLADPTHLHQIVMNLITNAYHAVEQSGGTITVRLGETTIGQEVPAGGSLTPGSYAMLSVCDTGQGIDRAVMDKIFEPYFTTKPQGKGTGLGLAVVYGIVKECHGDIQVSSRPGRGTTFTVYLPVIEPSAQEAVPETSSRLQTGSERLLLVDDEAPNVRLSQEMLKRLGYRVTARTDSGAALEVFRAAPEEYDLVITDMTMPTMTGDLLAKALIEIRPDIPVIICTGFSERLSRERAEALGIKGFLMKPIVISEMARTVRSVLDHARSERPSE